MKKSSVVYITLGQVRKAVSLCIIAQSFMPEGKRFGSVVWSQSGLGKNGVTDGLAEMFTEKTKKQWGHIDCNVASMTPEDMTGLPSIKNGRTEYAPVYKLPEDSHGIFRVDELDRPAYFQNLIAIAKFAIDRTVENPLPINWFVLGLANGTSDAHTQELTEHLKGRFCHLYVSTNSTKAKNEMREYFETRDTTDAIQKLYKLNPIETRDEFEPHAIYNHRTLEYADSILKAYIQMKEIGQDYSDVLLAVLAGVIGKDKAVEAVRLLELADLPSLDQVIANPKGTEIPSDLSLRHKYTSMLVYEAQEDCQKAEKLLDFLVRLPNEVARYAIETLSTACPMVCKAKTYVEWINRIS